MTKTKAAAKPAANDAESRRLKKNAVQAAYRDRRKKATAAPEAEAEAGGFAPGVAEQIQAEMAGAPSSPGPAKRKARKPERKARAKKTIQPKAGQTRADLCIGLLKRSKGVTVAEIMEQTGWLPHTTRAFISATIGKKLGHKIETEKVDGRGRVYRIAA